jgi:hypothetical protein
MIRKCFANSLEARLIMAAEHEYTPVVMERLDITMNGIGHVRI